MTLTAKGITRTGQALGWPNIKESGTVRPWSTSRRLAMVRSNSSPIRLSVMCQASGWCPSTTGTGRGPHPSSAGAKASAQPMAKVGTTSIEKFEAWSL